MEALAGSRFGPYEIVTPLGTGGMGEVFRAKDPRLHRDVALKILQTESIGDPDRQRRFLMEARAASALNHPNILVVYDVGTENGVPFIVSELIDGESLREVIRNGPVPVKRLLDIAIQIADGLAAAHEAGIIHRDLKPENIMITRDNRVKILDFGLAKTVIPNGSDNEQTRTSFLTGRGVMVGTIAYMSPEQARAREIDFRSDQFSFGLILFEMASGKRAFHKDTPVQTLSAILTEEAPPLTSLNPKLPGPLRWQIERCLEKDPRERYGATIDLYHELKSLRDHLSETSFATDPALRLRPFRKTRQKVFAALLILFGLVAGFVGGLFYPLPDQTGQYSYTPLATNEGFESYPAWSPDGKSVAYIAEVGGVLQIFTKSLQSGNAAQITRSERDCFMPIWSADGASIYYVNYGMEGGKSDLWVVSAAGGSPQMVQENVMSAALSPDGQSLFTFRNETESGFAFSLWHASPPAAKPRRFLKPPFDTQRFVDASMLFSPDSSQIIARLNQDKRPEFWRIPYPDGDPVKIDFLMSHEIKGFSWFPDGRHAVISGSMADDLQSSHLWLLDTRTGSTKPITGGISSEIVPAVSPDGKKIAFTAFEGQRDVVEISLDGTIKDLVATDRDEKAPAWSPGGNQFVYVSNRNGKDEIWMKSMLEGSERPLITEKDFGSEPTQLFSRPSFSQDGQRIAYHRSAKDGSAVWVSHISGGAPVRLNDEKHDQFTPTWSPDGNWIAYILFSGGKFSVAKSRIGARGNSTIIKQDIIYFQPQWSPAGDWISYQTENGLHLVSPDGRNTRLVSKDLWLTNGWSGDGKIMYGIRQTDSRRLTVASIDVATGEEKMIADLGPSPALLGGPGQTIIGFSMAPDGKRFATSLLRAKGDLWILEGFKPSTSFLDRIR